MRKIFSLILALVFVVGVCVSAPITITANAANVEETGEYTLSIGGHTFIAPETGYYIFESVSDNDPMIMMVLDGETYACDDFMDGFEFKVWVYLEENQTFKFYLGGMLDDDFVPMKIDYIGTDKPDWNNEIYQVNANPDDWENGTNASEQLNPTHNVVNGVCSKCGLEEAFCIESDHPFRSSDMVYTYYIEKEGAKRIQITFSEETYCNDFCSISVYDGYDELVAYGFEDYFAGKTITIYDDTVRIDLDACDNYDDSFGFSLTAGKVYYEECKHAKTHIENACEVGCETPGYSGDVICDECGQCLETGSYDESWTGHKFDEKGICTACGEELYKYSVINDGVAIWKYNGYEEKVTIPSTINGKKVTSIIGWSNNRSIEITVPNTVTEISYSGFSNLRFLKKITLPNSLKQIKSSTFIGCESLREINLPDGLESIGAYAFANSTGFKPIIPSSVKEIGERAFGYWYEDASGADDWMKSEGFTICGTKGTVAEKYANDNGFKFEEYKIILAAPKVTQKNTEEGISLTWGKVENAESYRVYRRTYNTKTKKYSEWTTLSKAQKGTSFVDTKVKLGTTYSYMVKAINSGVLSKGTPTKNLKYNVTPTVTVANASKGISVSWSPIANATGYEVYSSTYNAKTKKWSSFTKRATAKANAKSWTDTKAKSGTKYKYTVKALNGKVASAYNKSGVQIVRLAQPTTKIVNASNGIKVSWGKVSGATSYEILRAEYNAKTKKWNKAKKVATAKSSATSWTDTKVKSGVQYRYTVKAVNGKIYSSAKTTSGLMFLTMPKPTVKAVKTGITVTWTPSTGATNYEVYRAEYNKKTKKYTAFKKVATAKSTAKSYTDKTAKKGVKYKYTVKAINNKTASAYKSSAEVKR